MGFYPDNRILFVVELGGSIKDFQGNRGFLDFVLPPEQYHIAQVFQQLYAPPRLRKETRLTDRLNFIPYLTDRGAGLRVTLLHLRSV
jgi:hypothetical protein